MFTRIRVDLKYIKKILNSEKQKVKCHLCNFHYKFNVLLGHEALKQLKISWVIDQDLIRLGKKYFKLQYLQERNIETNKKEINNI